MRHMRWHVGLVVMGLALALTVGARPAVAETGDGWVHEDQSWQYVEHGTRVTGWRWLGGAWYYFDDAGIMRTGWQYLGGSWYYLQDSGAMATGWLHVGGAWYYLRDSGAMATGWLRSGAQWYWLTGSGAMATGWQQVAGSWYYLNPSSGSAVRGWMHLGSWYYFDTSNRMVTGWLWDGSHWYLMADSGSMLTGWQRSGGSWYWLDASSGSMATGWLWDGTTYWQLASSGAWTGSSQRPQAIMGSTTVTAQQMASAYRRIVGASTYPSSVYAAEGASTIDQFCQTLVEEAKVEGVRGEIVFAQVMLETNWLRFGGDVSVEQCNFAGIGAVGGGAKGNDLRMDLDGDGSSDGVRAGLRVQVQHLKAYASTSSLVNRQIDPRYSYVRHGSVTVVQGLGIPDYPTGVGWAAAAGYGMNIVSLENRCFGLGY